MQPKCGTVPVYEAAHGDTCHEDKVFSNGETCKVYCKTTVSRFCSCTEILGGIISILKPEGCEWTGDACEMQTTKHTLATSVETTAKDIE